MPRFSSVQAYSDTQSAARAISYEQATGGSNKKEKTTSVVRAEKVINPSSSTAGAGSGEFHVYRHARAREMQRMQQIEIADQERQKDLEFAEKMQQYRQEEEARTAKRRKKRQRQKEAKLRKKNLAKAGVDVEGTTSTVATTEETAEEEADFTYVPLKEREKEAKKDTKKEETSSLEIPFANDGSFLEMMKKKLAEEAEKEKNEAIDDGAEPPTKKQAT